MNNIKANTNKGRTREAILQQKVAATPDPLYLRVGFCVAGRVCLFRSQSENLETASSSLSYQKVSPPPLLPFDPSHHFHHQWGWAQFHLSLLCSLVLSRTKGEIRFGFDLVWFPHTFHSQLDDTNCRGREDETDRNEPKSKSDNQATNIYKEKELGMYLGSWPGWPRIRR